MGGFSKNGTSGCGLTQTGLVDGRVLGAVCAFAIDTQIETPKYARQANAN
jgi:hypothetical protein